MLTACILIAVLIFFLLKWNTVKSLKNKFCLPPGPAKFPIVGHLPLLGTKPHVTLAKWKKIHGPIISIQFGSIRTVVLNDAKLIKEAFSQDVFSGRPYISMFHKVLGGKKGLVMNDGVDWSDQRKFAAKGLNEFGIRSMESKTQEEVDQLLDELGSQIGHGPVAMKHRFSAPVLNALWSIIMGQRFKADDPELMTMVKNIETGTTDFPVLTGLAIAISWIGDTFPYLFGVTRVIDSLSNIRDIIGRHIDTHKTTRIQGQPRDFTDFYLDKIDATDDPQSSFHVEANQQRLTTSELFAAAFETTGATLEWLVVYMVLYPEIQIKLHKEIDQIVGHTRRPTLSDRPHMIYTEAVLCETMRFASSGPFGLFHSTMDHVHFGGFDIPKDTLIMSNFYCINHDPELWDEPDQFRPERFLSRDEREVKKFDHFLPFSWGKRRCIGEAMARDTLFLFCVGLFQKFKISKSHKLPSLDAKMGLLMSPPPFEVILQERGGWIVGSDDEEGG